MAKNPAAILYDEDGVAIDVDNPLRDWPTRPVDNPDNLVGTLTELDDTVEVAVEGYKSSAVVLTGTWVAEVVFEVSGDDGVTWTRTAMTTPAGSDELPNPLILTHVAENGTYMGFGNPVGTHIRVRASSYTSGTVNVTLHRSDIPLQLLFTQTSMTQYVVAAPGNSSTANLAAGASFTGPTETTLGVAGIQVNLKADQPCLVQIQQSNDGTNWDSEEEWLVHGEEGDGRTFQALASYFRILVTNLGHATTTYFRLQVAMCPIVEVLPKGLTPDGKLRLSTSSIGYEPDPGNLQDLHVSRALRLDASRQLITRSSVLTDEASFRDDFTDSSIYDNLTGTCYFTNGSLYVTGSGTSFTTEALPGHLLKLSAHDDDVLVEVAEVCHDNLLILDEGYLGATGNGVGVVSNWAYLRETGTTITEGSSELSLLSGTTSGSVVMASRWADYMPLVAAYYMRITQRIANQVLTAGLHDVPGSPDAQACFVFDGTTNTTVKCRTAIDSSSVEETTVTLPDGLTSAVQARYTIEMSAQEVTFTCNDVVLTRHRLHIPGNYDVMYNLFRIENTDVPSSSTTLYVDAATLANFNVLEVGRTAQNQPLATRTVEDIHTITGVLTTSSTTADQVILSYTVPAGKAFWITGYSIGNGETVVRGNPIKIGRNTITSEPAAPGVVDGNIFRMANMPSASDRTEDFSGNPRRMAVAGDVVKMTVTPTGVQSTSWRASIDFILR